jgi:hypothetical protein
MKAVYSTIMGAVSWASSLSKLANVYLLVIVHVRNQLKDK